MFLQVVCDCYRSISYDRNSCCLDIPHFFISILKSWYLSTFSCSLRKTSCTLGFATSMIKQFFFLLSIQTMSEAIQSLYLYRCWSPIEVFICHFQYSFWYMLVLVGITLKVVLLTEKAVKFFGYFVMPFPILFFARFTHSLTM